MEYSKTLVMFINHYIVLLHKLHMSVYARGRASVLDHIRRNLLHEIFFIFCHVGFDPPLRCTMVEIEKTAMKQFQNASMDGSDYKIEFFSPGVCGNEMKKTEIFALQLLLIMQLEYAFPSYSQWYDYLIKAPVYILKNDDDGTWEIGKYKDFDIDKGMECLNKLIEKYFDILYPVLFEEYRMDLVWIKIIYEKLFYRLKYDIRRNELITL